MLVSFSFDASLFEVLALGIVHRNAPALHRMNHWGHDAARDAKDGPSQACDELASGLLLLLVEAALLLAQAPIDLGPEADVQRVEVRRALGQRQDLDLSFCLRSLTRSRLVPRRVIVFQKEVRLLLGVGTAKCGSQLFGVHLSCGGATPSALHDRTDEDLLGADCQHPPAGLMHARRRVQV